MARMNESQRCCTKVGRWTAHQRIASFPRTLFRDREGHMMYDYADKPGLSPRGVINQEVLRKRRRHKINQFELGELCIFSAGTTINVVRAVEFALQTGHLRG